MRGRGVEDMVIESIAFGGIFTANMRAMGEKVLRARAGGGCSERGGGKSGRRTALSTFSEAQTPALGVRPCVRDCSETTAIGRDDSLTASDRSQMG